MFELNKLKPFLQQVTLDESEGKVNELFLELNLKSYKDFREQLQIQRSDEAKTQRLKGSVFLYVMVNGYLRSYTSVKYC